MKKLVLFLSLVIMLVISYYLFDLGQYVTTESIKNVQGNLTNFIEENYGAAVLSFIAVYATATAVSFPASSLITLLAGALFGWIEGAAYVVMGATIGATAIFYIARYLLTNAFEKLVGDKRIKRIQVELAANGSSYLLFLRLTPLFPFWVVNIVPAFVGVKTFQYIWTTFIGIIPGTLAYTYAGRQLSEIDQVGDVLSSGFISALIILALFSLLPAVIKKVRGQSNRES